MSAEDESARSKANRANARRSTGPKSSRGKQRASKNALQYGLSIPIQAMPSFSGEVDHLALRLVAGNARDNRLETARAVAAEHIDVERIRETRKLILNRVYRHFVDGGVADADAESTLPGEMKALERCDRYERRALSRRRSAIRLFDLMSLGLNS